MTLWPLMTISPTSPCSTSLPSSSTQLHLDALDRRADRADLALLVGVVEGGDRRGLRQAVALEDHACRTPSRSRASARRASPSRRSSSSCSDEWSRSSRDVVVEHRVVHRRHAGEHRHLVALDDLQRLGGIEARDERERRAADSAQAFMQHVWPKEWNSGSAPSTTSSSSMPNRFRDACRVVEHVVVGQLGALGLAGGARRVEDHRGVGAVALGDLARRLGVAEQLLELAGLDEDRPRLPASSAPFSAASAKSCHANTHLASGSSR